MIRTLILLFAIALASCYHHRNRTEWKQWVKEHNRVANRTWTARVAKELNLEDEDQLRSLIGAQLSPNANQTYVTNYRRKGRLLAQYPENYDLRTAYPKCTSTSYVRNQFSCGACWAFSTMNSLSDRTCIKTHGQSKPVDRRWSTQDMLECCDQDTCGVAITQGCNGGFLDGAFAYALKTGVVTGEQADDTVNCKPFFLSSFVGLVASPACRAWCTNSNFKGNYAADRMKIKGYKTYSINAMTMDDLQAAVQDAMMKRGTLVAFLRVYADIYAYGSGVYQTDGVNMLGAHAVRLIGWGVTPEGVKFWLIANSWGEWWGEKGFFRIVRGINNSSIEEFIIEGIV